MLVRSPKSLPEQPFYKVFLAGSIAMGKALHWQAQVETAFADNPGILLCNPRREDWDGSWTTMASDPQFREQVGWELDAMELADLIVMYFASGTQAPVTLLELGLQARSGKLVVCCPDDFWRKGNVDMVCERFRIPQVRNVEALIEVIEQKYNERYNYEQS